MARNFRLTRIERRHGGLFVAQHPPIRESVSFLRAVASGRWSRFVGRRKANLAAVVKATRLQVAHGVRAERRRMFLKGAGGRFAGSRRQ